MCVFGTRPEAIKMAPVIRALQEKSAIIPIICTTGQHRELLDQVLDVFELTPDVDLAVMAKGQDLFDVTSRVMIGMRSVLTEHQPDRVLVHGDTTTTLAASLASFYAKIPVGHVEAGLRTRNMHAPWPEELNRRVAGVVADLHFAPTEKAQAALLSESVANDSVHLTGNTVIDALRLATDRIESDLALQETIDAALPALSDRRLVLVTGHRRESFGDGFEQICRALATLADRDDVDLVYPVHLNPNVREPVERLLGTHPRIHLISPLDYLPFVRLMSRASLVITDSGGVQEEAPSFGIPVLVMRETTERPEAVTAGVVKLVGAVEDRIVSAATELLDDPEAFSRMAKASNPYGDGLAADRIANILTGDSYEPYRAIPA
ncbi:MAG: UDP-N-acetylglucosamine 2-epimerase (non-hydrolyzing) [Pseudomonadota bacterium]